VPFFCTQEWTDFKTADVSATDYMGTSMPEMIDYGYAKDETKQVADFIDSAKEHSAGQRMTLDSAADFGGEIERHNVALPKSLREIMDRFGDGEQAQKAKSHILKAVFDSVSTYESEHGVNAPADVVEQALHNAQSIMLDSVSSTTDAHQPLSLQANSAIVAILSVVGEMSIPFAHYAPADRKSNEAKIGILATHANSNFGGYSANDTMVGINSGMPFMDSTRIHTCNAVAGTGNATATGKLTIKQTEFEVCDPAADSVPVLPGRCRVYVEGSIVAAEISSEGGTDSRIAGTFSLKDDPATTYTLAGSINCNNGVFSLVFTPGLDSLVDVVVESFIDFEVAPALIPAFGAKVTVKSVFAHPARAQASISKDSMTQMKNELGLDGFSEMLLAFNIQYANERYYRALVMARRLGILSPYSFNLDFSAKTTQRTRSDMWRDFGAILMAASQTMSNRTLGYGISHLYVGINVASHMYELPRDIWQPSGIKARPGVFRLGRLFGLYDVYYTPKVVQESEDGTAAEILAIGRSYEVANNSIVVGDAVAPHIEDLGKKAELAKGAAFYSRSYTELNPHKHTNNAFCVFNITNMK
jgi:hypothetical protein